MFKFLGSETIDSNSSQEDFNNTPICTENDCDEIYRTARKGRQVGRGVSLKSNFQAKKIVFVSIGIRNCLVMFNNDRPNDCC